MPELLSILSTVVDTAKKLREISGKIKDAEARNLVADLNLSLADLKMKLAEVQEENLSLKEQIQKSKRIDDFRSMVEHRDGLYYLKEEVEGRSEGPYCTNCLDGSNKLILLTKQDGPWKHFGEWQCPSCKENFGKSKF